MPTKRFENLDPDRKKSILDAARKEFYEKGYERASLNEIVKKADISKGSLYYYFEDKLDLYITIVEQVIQDILKPLGDLKSEAFAEDFWENITGFICQSIQFSTEHPETVMLIRELMYMSTTSNPPESIKAFFEKTKAVTAEIIEIGQRIGEVRTDVPIDLLVSLMMYVDRGMDLYMLERWESMSPDEINTLYGIYTGIIKKMLKGEPTQEGGES